MTAPMKRPQSSDPWEKRLIRKHGFPPPFARAYADLRRGQPD